MNTSSLVLIYMTNDNTLCYLSLSLRASLSVAFSPSLTVSLLLQMLDAYLLICLMGNKVIHACQNQSD